MSTYRGRLSREMRAEASESLRALAAALSDVMADAGGSAAMARCYVDGGGKVVVAWNLYATSATHVTGATVPVVEGREVLS